METEKKILALFCKRIVALGYDIESLYYKCYEDPVWEGSYDNEAIFLKRCIDHS